MAPDIAPLDAGLPDIPGRGRTIGEDCVAGGPGTDGKLFGVILAGVTGVILAEVAGVT